MIFIGVLVGLIIMTAMIYLAVDKKSNFATRVASLIAIGVMVLTTIICLIIISSGGQAPVDESLLIVGAPAEKTSDQNGNNTLIVLLVAFVFIALLALLVFISLREHKKHLPKKQENKFKLSDKFNL
ncbi:MAG: hypothetical protein LBI12_06540 [Treponema sp.]|nr:hypothetical protein [Treponema sp.]